MNMIFYILHTQSSYDHYIYETKNKIYLLNQPYHLKEQKYYYLLLDYSKPALKKELEDEEFLAPQIFFIQSSERGTTVWQGQIMEINPPLALENMKFYSKKSDLEKPDDKFIQDNVILNTNSRQDIILHPYYNILSLIQFAKIKIPTIMLVTTLLFCMLIFFMQIKKYNIYTKKNRLYKIIKNIYLFCDYDSYYNYNYINYDVHIYHDNDYNTFYRKFFY